MIFSISPDELVIAPSRNSEYIAVRHVLVTLLLRNSGMHQAALLHHILLKTGFSRLSATMGII